MLAQQIINGLSLGGVYALFALGFTLVFGVLNVVNLAHGAIFMIGAYAA
jgi:branched-chain amino acid transport system permease protein